MVELEVAGHDVVFATINITTGLESQAEILKHCSFPQFQDTDELGLWELMGGGKDDFYVFDREGKLHTYFRYYGAISTNLSEQEGYDNVKNAMLAALEGKGPTLDDPPDGDVTTARPDASPSDATADDTGPLPGDDAVLQDAEASASDAAVDATEGPESPDTVSSGDVTSDAD